MKVVTVVGARPQFIKAACVSRVFEAQEGIEEILIHTGQHYDPNMSEVFFTELGIPVPNYHLCVGSGLHSLQTGRMMEKIEEVLLGEKPDWLLVYGDTNSTLAGALAASKLQVPVAHVEAGLRSYVSSMPEEINRVLTDHVSKLLFTPNSQAISNLRREGISGNQVMQVGDVMYDASLYYGEQAEQSSRILETLNLKQKSYVVATLHRANNTDDPERLWTSVRGLSKVAETLPVVWPMHPRTRNILSSMREVEGSERLTLIDPVGYLDMVMLEKYSKLIVTDSGGVQKEAFFHRVPCVTLRKETEWTELVDSGWNELCSPVSPDVICDTVMKRLNTSGKNITPYGSGATAQEIVKALLKWSGDGVESTPFSPL